MSNNSNKFRFSSPFLALIDNILDFSCENPFQNNSLGTSYIFVVYLEVFQ